MRSFLAAILFCCSAIDVMAVERREVFVLHSYSQEYPWTKRQHEGFLRGLAQDSTTRYDVRAEYLDTKRVRYDAAYARLIAEHLAAKYRRYTPDAVYVTDDNALVFALEHLAHIFPDAPVVFSGVNDYGARARLDPSRVTGVFERKEIAPNLELVRHLAPDVDEIVVAGDASETYIAIEQELRGELARHPGVRARFVADRRLDRLLEGLRAGGERFLFLTTLGALVDAEGKPLMLSESISAIVALKRHTVISMEDVYLFPGVLGGYVTSGVAQGETAARLLTRHFAGTSIREIAPLEASPNVYLMDAAELERSGLRLPPEVASHATILNPRPSFYQRNERYIAAAFYILGATLALVLAASLAIVMRKNRQIGATATALMQQALRMEEVQESLLRAQRIAGMGNWDWRIPEDRLYWSENIYRLFGVHPDEFDASYEALLDCVHSDDRADLNGAVREALEDRKPFDITHRIVLPGGEVRVVRENAEIVRDASGKPLRMIGTVLDVTERERTARALRESEQQLRTVIEGLPVVLWMIDREGRFLLSEGKGLQVMGLEPGQVVGQSLFALYRDSPDLVADAHRVLRGESFTCTRNAGTATFELRYSPLRDADGAVTGAIGVAIDVSDRIQSEQRLAFLANYDPVTELPNRFLFGDRLTHAMRNADRTDSHVALLFVDLDQFKTINDTLGHAAGDELLKQVAGRLSAVVRNSDTVSRLGGDEFTVILENLSEMEQAASVAAKILEQCATPYRLRSTEIYVTPSIGIALYPRDGASADTLLMNADAAMYRAKENGRNGFQFFTRDITARAQERLALGNELRGALAHGEFSLHYQPKVSLADDSVIGFEALLRWRNPRLGQVSPALFVPLLEETGLIIEVGEWIMLEACRWAASLPEVAGVRPDISVNISARQFREPQLERTVEEALEQSGLAASRLELEITESTLIDLEANVQTMDRLKNLGVRLSIDDFGTGYSSLSYLKRFPVDRLKIDASFVRDVAFDANDAAIVTAIVGLAHHLDMRVIAEGVETAEQVKFLRGQGCDEIQGYLVARPMPAEQALAWLQSIHACSTRSLAALGA